MKTVSDVDVEGKKVVLRTDLNLPIENREPSKTVRFRRYLETIEELSERGAKTVLVAHQGRPGRDDFTSLEKHSQLLSNSMNQDIDFIPGFFGGQVEEALSNMENGDVALLENIRFLSEELRNASPEEHSEDIFVKKLSQYFDLYVDDAFSAAHRSHGSMVGLPKRIEPYAGPVMSRELESCSKVRDRFEDGLMVLGGEKPSDLIGIIDEMIESVDKVLLGGVPGELALIIEGYNLGDKEEWIRKKGFDEKEKELEEILNKYREKIVLPEDLRTADGIHEVGDLSGEMVWDIGPETEKEFAEEIKNAEAMVMKGPIGAFEEHPQGTKTVIDAAAASEAYTVLGGGHTSSLVQRFDHELEDFSHVSIAGGAFVSYLSGEKLPAIEVLK